MNDMKIDLDEEAGGVTPVSAVPWEPEIHFFQVLTQFIIALQVKMNEADWTMSPAKAYDLLASAVEWAQANHVHGWDNPAWAVVIDMLRTRSEALAGTSTDAMLAQRMTTWKNRRRPSALHLLKRLVWYMPLFMRATEILDSELADDDTTASGQSLTIGEAVGVVFEFVDWCSKSPYFKQQSAWGWWQAYPWLDFVRDEMKELRDELKDGTGFDPGAPIGDVPFSFPG